MELQFIIPKIYYNIIVENISTFYVQVSNFYNIKIVLYINNMII